MENPLLFVLAVVAVLGTPGPTNTLLMVSGAMAGPARSLPLVAAEAGGYSISILAIGLLLEPLVSAVPGLGDLLRVIVGTYLIFLGIRMWRGSGMPIAAASAPSPAQVFMTTLLNPKAILFALQIIPFRADHVWVYFLAFLAILVVVSVAWMYAGVMAGQFARGRGHMRVVPRTGAAAIAIFGLMMIATPIMKQAAIFGFG